MNGCTEQCYKIIVIGDATVGKTSFLQRYVRSVFPRNYQATMGVDFFTKILRLNNNATIRLQLWDIAGQERFTSMTRVYYKGAHACLIMCDVTNRKSFCNVVRWKQDLDSKCTSSNGDPLPCLLLANKADLHVDRQVETSELSKLCRDLTFAGWNETSTKTGLYVEESMSFLLEEILANQQRNSDFCTDSIKLNHDTNLQKIPTCPCR